VNLSSRTLLSVLAALVAALLCAPPVAYAQSVTGQISGTVTDASDAPMSGVTAQLTHDLTKQVRTMRTESNGAFIFPNLVPGDYSIQIAHPGFKTYVQQAIAVSANEKVSLHTIRLALGDVSTTVTVQAESARVATDSSDRTIQVDENMIDNTPVRGRDWLGVLQTLPGIVDLNEHNVPGWNSGMPTVNGGQTGQVLITLDGVASQDSGCTTGTVCSGYMAPSADAIAEVKVMVSNYAAQYGSRGGGQLVVTVKGGSNQYHGSAYYFHRHEQFNANEYFNNQQSLSKPLYRYKNAGGTFGGPLLIPGTNFNKSRTRLFFFFSEDFLKFVTPSSIYRFNMPTALERQGDFSKTTTTTGVTIPIRDPFNNRTQFPGNIVPASRISPEGAAILNLFPLPFTTDPTGQRQYNAIYQFWRRNPREDRILRLDFNLAPKTQTFVRLMNDYQGDRGIGGTLNSVGGWGQMQTAYGIQSAGAVFTAIHTFRSNIINELTVGVNRAHQTVGIMDEAEYARNQLPALKTPDGKSVKLPKLYPGNSFGLMKDLIPNIRFSTLNPQSAGQGITNPAAFTFDARFPFDGTDQVENIVNTVSWIKGPHTIKFGFYYERMARNVSVYSQYNVNGSYYFGSDTASQFDTNYGYSNALTGAVQAFGEDNGRITDHVRYNQFEWFAQDSWRVSRRLNLDYGVRFAWHGALSTRGGVLGFFDGSTFDASKSGQLLYPAVVGGQNVAINPKTKAEYQFARAVSFDPLSYGTRSPYSGMVQYKERAYENPGTVIGPRIGFASDLFGNGRMALRGGFGIFYDRAFSVGWQSAIGVGVGPLMAPPSFQAPTYYNTNFSQLTSAQGFLTPQNVFTGTKYKTPSTYTWSLGIQNNLGRGFIFDVAYVGNSVHNRYPGTLPDVNGVKPYTTWNPTTGRNQAYVDPTVTSAAGAFYNANLLRPYAGYGIIYASCSCINSNYHSLQTQLNRRFGKRLQFGANWTWSKTMTSARNPWTPDYLAYAEVSSSRPQVVNANYSYAIPNGSRIWKNVVTRTAFDGWRINGIVKLMSGTPLTVGCSASNAPIGYWTGTPTGGIPFRCDYVDSNPFKAEGYTIPSNIQPRLYFPLNAANYKLPAATSLGIGNTPPTLFYGPGYESFDFSLMKDFNVRRDGKWVVQFKAEAYNVLNHFNPGNPNTSVTINYNNNTNTNANLGSITAAIGQARRVAFSAKLRF
jgi:hypothetical protein